MVPDVTDCNVRRDTPDRASEVEANAEGWGEQAEAHREDRHHRVVNLVDAHHARDWEEKRAKKDDGRNAFEHAAENDEGKDRYHQEADLPARHRGHQLHELPGESRLCERP